MVKIKDVIYILENIAPKTYQEQYDNAGLITGNQQTEAKGIVVTLDCTEEVVEEAIEAGCNLIVAHHPIVFKGLKTLTGKNYVERTVIKAIKNDIAIYAIHTNLDNVWNGVNSKISEVIGLINTKILSPKLHLLTKLVTFVPAPNVKQVLEALYAAGAGNIGNYENCSFRVAGTGTFKPNDQANPYIGKKNIMEEVAEERIEVIFPSYLEKRVLSSLRNTHPYEEVAYYMQKLENENQEVGSGMIGELNTSISEIEFLKYLKEKMQLSCIRHTKLLGKQVSKVAVCGGAGSFLLQDAIRQGADVFVSADFKYHEFFDADGQVVIADVGHYESEISTKDLLYDILTKNFTNIAIYLSKKITNPISYL